MQVETRFKLICEAQRSQIPCTSPEITHRLKRQLSQAHSHCRSSAEHTPHPGTVQFTSLFSNLSTNSHESEANSHNKALSRPRQTWSIPAHPQHSPFPHSRAPGIHCRQHKRRIKLPKVELLRVLSSQRNPRGFSPPSLQSSLAPGPVWALGRGCRSSSAPP